MEEKWSVTVQDFEWIMDGIQLCLLNIYKQMHFSKLTICKLLFFNVFWQLSSTVLDN